MIFKPSNLFKAKEIYKHLTRQNDTTKQFLKLGTKDIPIPAKKQNVIDIEAVNRFNKANPRVDTTDIQPVVKQSTIKQSNAGEVDEGVIQGAFDTATVQARDGGYPPPKYEAFKKRYLKKNMKADGGRINFDSGGSPLQRLRQSLVDDLMYKFPSMKEEDMQMIVKDINLGMSTEEAQTSMSANFTKIFGGSDMFADGGRIGYDEGSKLTDFVDVQASGSITGKNQVEGAPDGITANNQLINAIIRLDIPLSEKTNFLADYSYGKGRTKYEEGDKELFLDEGGYTDRNVGFGYNQDGEGFGGSVMRNLRTGDDDVKLKFKKTIDFNRLFKADGGMLVQPSDDGSRPGYNGKPGEYDRGSFTEKQQKKIKDAFPKIKFNFLDYKYGVPVYNKPGKTGGTNKDYTKIIRFIDQGYKIKEFKTDLLKKPIRELVMANFELPSGVDEWNFNKYKYGIPGTGTDGENMNLGKRISKYIKEKPSWTLATDRSSAKGWMMSSMERLYNNQKGKTKNLTYDPIFETIDGKKIIIGFTDNTESGKGKTYYGLKKYEKKNHTPWINHGDYKNVSKFIDISKRSFNEPNAVIKDILKQKGINQSLKLNDILNFDRYFETLNKTTSKELLKNAIVKHHISGVGGGTGSGKSIAIANAAATKDLQLLTAATNNKVRKIENKLKVNGFISAEDNLTLKNLGASIRGANGKLYGGGSTTAIGGFKAIEKQAEEIVKGDKFNVKNIKKYVAALGGGACSVFSGKKADGGRIGLATGTPNIDDCFKSGRAVINSGKIPVDKADDFAQFLKRAGSLGRSIMKIGIIPEALYVAADSLIRVGMGDTFKEAGLRASDWFLPGDQTKIAEMSKVERIFGQNKANLVGRAIDYKNQLLEISGLEKTKTNLELLSGDGGAFDIIGDTTKESSNIGKQILQKKNELNNKFKISEAELNSAENIQDEAYDRSKANSLFTKLKAKFRDVGQDQSDIETVGMPEKSQIDLNLNMIPFDFRSSMLNPETRENLNFSKIPDEEFKKYLTSTGEIEQLPLYLDEKKRLQSEFSFPVLEKKFGKEQLYGTQGSFFGETISPTVPRVENSIENLEREAVGQKNKFNSFDRDTSVLGTGLRGFSAASGGIASLTKTIPPESGPTPQGLPYVYNNVKKI